MFTRTFGVAMQPGQSMRYERTWSPCSRSRGGRLSFFLAET